ncbi:hypothetical protein BH09PAT2_BH09PAT2_03510 [soil metagenome]
MIIIILITLAYTFLRGLHLTYLFQIKEYRFDRLFSLIRENGFIHTFYTSANRLPAISPRNMLIVFFLAISSGLLFLLALEHNFLYYFMSVSVIVAPLLSFLLISLAVIVTEIPAKIYRYVYIFRAIKKVRNSKTTFIGITGTYGKTSVKEYVAFILSTKYKVAKTEKNMNTGVGIAICINKNLSSDTDFFIAEVGSYKIGETQQATWYIPFKYGILTGLGNQHLDLYGSRESLIQEEISMLTNIDVDNYVYINHHVYDYENIIKLMKAKIISYGLHHSQIKARILSISPDSIKAVINYRGYEFTIETHLPGEHSLVNLLPAIAIGMDCGIKPRDIVHRVAEMKPVEGKLSVHTSRTKAVIINDAVNSNVDGFIAALAVLKRYPQKSKYVISLGIIELGVEKRASYEKILQELHNVHAKLLTTDPLFKTLDTQNAVMIFNDVLQLHDKIKILMNRHTVVLLEGKLPENIKKSLMNPIV